MSSFLCSDEHISYVAKDVASGLGREDVEALALEMHQMNVTALIQRYGDKPEDFKPFKYVADVKPETMDFGDYYKWKSGPECPLKQLACYLYQCAEGDAPGFSLYKALRKVEEEREKAYLKAHRVDIDSSDAYTTGPWGIK